MRNKGFARANKPRVVAGLSAMIALSTVLPAESKPLRLERFTGIMSLALTGLALAAAPVYMAVQALKPKKKQGTP